MSTHQRLTLDFAASFTANTATAWVATTALAVFTCATWAHAPWWIIAGIGAAISIAAYLSHRSRRLLEKPHHVHRGVSAVTALWTAVVCACLASDPYTWGQAGACIALAAGVAATGVTYWILDAADIADEAFFANTLQTNGATPEETEKLTTEELAKGPRAQTAQEWGKKIKASLNFTPTISGLEHWKPINGTSPGLTLTVDLPKGTDRTVFNTANMVRLASDADLDNGCTITSAKGARQSQVLLHIETTNPASITHYAQADWTPKSIHDRQRWGVSPHGQPIGPYLREAGALIVGAMGSGKSTLVHNILMQLSRCPDVVVFGIDTGKQGKMFRPWTTNLPPGAKSVVHRVARTPREAFDMIEALQRGMSARVHAYAQDQVDQGTDLIPISPQVPFIVLIIDEGAELLNITSTDPYSKKFRDAYLTYCRTTREAGSRPILTLVKADVMTSGSSDMISYHPNAVGLVGDKDPNAEAPNKLFGMNGHLKGIDWTQIRAKGAGVANYGPGPEIHRGELSTWDMIAECVLHTTPLRGPIDQPTMRAFGSWWTDTETLPTLPNIPDPGPTNAPVDWTITDAPDMSDFEADLATNLATNTDDTTGLAWLHTATASLNHTTTTATEPEDDGPIYTGWRKTVLQHLKDNPDRSFSTSQLVTILTTIYGHQLARQTLSTQLNTWGENGTITPLGNGAHRTYTHHNPNE